MDFEYGPSTPGWNERRKYDLVRAFEALVACGYEDEFGIPPLVDPSGSAVVIRNVAHLRQDQLDRLTVLADRTYYQIMSERDLRTLHL